jgi:hypothetical protein
VSYVCAGAGEFRDAYVAVVPANTEGLSQKDSSCYGGAEGGIDIAAMNSVASVPSLRRVPTGFSHARLMEYSEQYLAMLAQSGATEEAHIATRLLQDVSLYRYWEQSHHRLMRGVAARRQRPQQSVELKKISFLTLHRKAPFEYLRNRQVQGQARRQLVRALFGTTEYTQCILREHMAYLSSAGSFLCTDSLCGDLMRNPAFSEALEHYQNSYNEYYRAYCDSLLAEQAGETSPVQALLPYLRYQLKMIRDHMLSGAPHDSDFMRLQSLYKSLGDTQKLPILRQH